MELSDTSGKVLHPVMQWLLYILESMKFIVYLLAVAFSSSTLLAQEAASTPAKEPVTTLLDVVKSGGWAMIPLGAMSVLTVMLVLGYLFTLRRGAIASANFMNTADVLLKKRDYHGLLAISTRHGELVARVVQRTLEFATRNPGSSFATVREIAQTEGSTLAASLQNRIVYLADIGMLAPMVGLLGTVMGIIKSFATLASNTSNTRQMLLASGISEALVCTATGLILGISSMACYSLFRGRVQSLISDLETASSHVLGLLALDYNKKQDTSSKAFATEDGF
jgi:biopolymer transport protein ExbB